MPRVLIAIADGIEEIETAAISDTLKRAGAEITIAAVGRQQIVASRGLKIMADCLIDEIDAVFDLIALPGGMPGAENLRNSTKLKQLLTDQLASGRLIGAICAAPAVVLQRHGLIQGRRATCFPAYLELLDQPVDAPVVIDGNCITSQGPGTAIRFALSLVEGLFGAAKRAEVASQMLVSETPEAGLPTALLASLPCPLMFVDNQHIVSYMNPAAARHYRGGYELLGSSIFECHSAQAGGVIREVYAAMLGGLEERKIIDNAKHVVYMRAVRAADGRLLGYYERYEPPTAKPATPLT